MAGKEEGGRKYKREGGKKTDTEIWSQTETLLFLLSRLGRYIQSLLTYSSGWDNPKLPPRFKEREHRALLLMGHIVRSTCRKRSIDMVVLEEFNLLWLHGCSNFYVTGQSDQVNLSNIFPSNKKFLTYKAYLTWSFTLNLFFTTLDPSHPSSGMLIFLPLLILTYLISSAWIGFLPDSHTVLLPFSTRAPVQKVPTERGLPWDPTLGFPCTHSLSLSPSPFTPFYFCPK